jgi:aryl-alcohol dehydrogenase (NADP+)
MFAWQFMKALGLQRARGLSEFVSMQNHYNLAYREEEREMQPLCHSEGIGLIPWSPLARGFLTGNRKPSDNPKKMGAASANAETARAASDEFAHALYYREQDFEIVDRVSTVGKKHGRPMAQVALSWLLMKPGVTAPIVGASKPGHLEDAVAALSLKLDAEDMKALEEPYKPKRVMGHT